MTVQLQRHEFDSIGSLYFAGALQIANGEQVLRLQVNNAENTDDKVDFVVDSERVEIENLTIGSSSPATSLDNHLSSVARTKKEETNTNQNFVPTANFTIGHMFDEAFVSESRVYLPGNRSPFQRSLEWMQASVAMQLEFINKGIYVSTANTDELDNSEYDSSF